MKIDSEKVLLLLAERGLTRTELCALADITHKTLLHTLRTGGSPKIIGKIARGLNVSIPSIVIDEKEKVTR